MMDSGKKIKSLEREPTFFLMETTTTVNIKMEYQMDMVFTHGIIKASMKGNL